MSQERTPDPKGKSLEQMSEAKFVRWKEKRGEGWSETRYSGLALEIDGRPVIISRLSHGLRVLLRKQDSGYSFEGEPITVKIPTSFIDSARMAFEADSRFQEKTEDYEKAISGK